MVLTPEATHLEFIDRLSNLPVVTFAWNYASDIYGKTKDSNAVLRRTLATAETAAKFAAGRAAPVVTRLEKPLLLVDSLACKGLDQVEGRLPVISKSPEEIVCTVKKYGAQKVDNVKSTVSSVADYGFTTATKLLDNKVGLLALDGVNWALSRADDCIEHYLPAGENEEQNFHSENKTQEDGEADPKLWPVEKKVSQSVSAVEHISFKMQHRLYGATLSTLRDIQHRGHSTMKAFAPTNYLLQLAETLLQNVNLTKLLTMVTAKQIWEELNKPESDDDKQVTLGLCATILARRLTRQLVSVGTSAVKAVEMMPATVRSKMDNALQLATKMYDEVWKAASLERLQYLTVLKQRTQEVQEYLLSVALDLISLAHKSKTAESVPPETTKRKAESKEHMKKAENMDAD